MNLPNGAISNVFVEDSGEISGTSGAGVDFVAGNGYGIDSARVKGLYGLYDQCSIKFWTNVYGSGPITNVTVESPQIGKLTVADFTSRSH